MSNFRAPEKDPYAVLNVNPDADLNTIKSAFRTLSLARHPDKAGNTPSANAEFIKIRGAYEFLIDVDRRRSYDLTRHDNDRKLPTSDNNKNNRNKPLRNNFHHGSSEGSNGKAQRQGGENAQSRMFYTSQSGVSVALEFSLYKNAYARGRWTRFIPEKKEYFDYAISHMTTRIQSLSLGYLIPIYDALYETCIRCEAMGVSADAAKSLLVVSALMYCSATEHLQELEQGLQSLGADTFKNVEKCIQLDLNIDDFVEFYHSVKVDVDAMSSYSYSGNMALVDRICFDMLGNISRPIFRTFSEGEEPTSS
ncbi:hypothetical protein F4779DRAFT_621353 [Xylariaceae sp. FL0662B]|nr:hypothetical protein F4779DRAFT_621353 [Xylariaceae sp. FL0662B]